MKLAWLKNLFKDEFLGIDFIVCDLLWKIVSLQMINIYRRSLINRIEEQLLQTVVVKKVI